MIKLSKIEDMVAGWVKPLPHLPAKGRKWLAENFWWIVLIGTIILGLASIALLNVLSLFGNSMNYFNLYGTTTLTGWAYFVTLISLLFMVVEIVLMSMAIDPLKKMRKRGWDLMFIVLLVSTTATIVNLLINYNSYSPVTTLLTGAIIFIVNAYLLLEIRSYFIKAK